MKMRLVVLALSALGLLFAACDSEQELSDPKTYPYESLPAFLSAEDFAEIQLQQAAVLPCPDGVSAAVNFTADNQAFGLTVAYEEGLRATAATNSADGVDTVVALFGPDDGSGYFGALPIALDDDGGADGRLSSLLETIDEAGDYFVVVTTAGGAGRGSVTLLVGAANCESAGCRSDDDCEAGEICVDGLCVVSGDPCLDIRCADGEICVDGTCIAQGACAADSDCVDGYVCLDGQCVISGDPCLDIQCAGGEACVDGECVPQDLCAANDDCPAGFVCVAGLCTEEVVGCQDDSACDDADPCTIDTCDPAVGDCLHELDPACAMPCSSDVDCEDGYVCMNGLCGIEGACLADSDCDDSNPCTMDLCDPTTALCLHTTEDGLACDDGDPCTGDDACLDGVCVGVFVCDEPCEVDSDCAAGYVCMNGFCAQMADPCGGIVCAGGEMCVNGECIPTPACADDSDCAIGQICVDGLCIDGAGACSMDLDCEDANACTQDICLNGMCFHDADAAGLSCDDGDACTFDDMCEDGACVGAPVDCDDGNVCTLDYCDAATGACVHTLDPACD